MYLNVRSVSELEFGHFSTILENFRLLGQWQTCRDVIGYWAWSRD